MKNKIENENKSGATLAEALVWIVIFFAMFCGLVYALSFWTERSIEGWLGYFDKAPDCPRAVAVIVSVFMPIAIVANIATEVIRLFW